MSAPFITSKHLDSSDETSRFAQQIGALLRAGDVLLLIGGIGAGKTHFARSLIQSLQDPPEDVPSPTFTLVQEYDTQRGPVWHADLYRLTSPDECIELGLTEAFETAICLIEWPDRLADLVPDTALSLAFSNGSNDESRVVTLSWTDPRWSDIAADVVS